MARQPIEGNRKRFQLKLIEMLGKGFREKEHHDFVSDIEQSRAAYKINKGEVEYFVIRALLSLPVLATAEAFLMTIREVIEFYKKTLLKLINSFVPKMECLRAIEDANFECDHLKYKECSASLVHFMTLTGILDGETVMQFYRNLQERNSYLASQESFRMMITWLQDEAAKKRLEERRRLIELSEEEDDDDVPLSQILMKSIERAYNIKPLCVWATRADDSAYQKYKPLLVLVRKNEAEAASNDTDEQSEEEDNANDDAQNENEDENPEQHYGEVEQSDVEDQDEDEEDDTKDFSDLESEYDDIPLEYLKNMVKNMKKVVRH